MPILVFTGTIRNFADAKNPDKVDELSRSSEATVAVAVSFCDPIMDAIYLSVHNGLVKKWLRSFEQQPEYFKWISADSHAASSTVGSITA
jgi:hypothetical protein